MDDPGDRTGPKRRGRADGNRSAVDAGERDEDCSDSDSSDSVYESTRLEDLSASLRVFFDSVIKEELTESEMMRSREALRLEAEKRRVETDSELTQMLVQTQMQIASFVADIDSSRKRKRVGEDESPVSQR